MKSEENKVSCQILTISIGYEKNQRNPQTHKRDCGPTSQELRVQNSKRTEIRIRQVRRTDEAAEQQSQERRDAGKSLYEES